MIAYDYAKLLHSPILVTVNVLNFSVKGSVYIES